MTLPTALLTAVVVLLGPSPHARARQQPFDVVPVGVRYDPDPDPIRRKTDLDTIRRLRFAVVDLGSVGEGQPHLIARIDPLIAGDSGAGVTMAAREVGRVPVDATSGADRISERAWTLLASGATAVIFDDWKTLRQNDGALAEAAAFADTLALNPALYAPLRRVEATGDRAFTIGGGEDSLEAHWLESSDALLLVAVNHADAPREVTLTFAPAIPEAVWQNMLTGSAVNFVAGPTGPVYTRTFPARGVLVLMIRKRWK
jgi:hypothetical protein